MLLAYGVKGPLHFNWGTMKRSFYLNNLKTISINAMYTTKRFITQDYSEWLMQVKHRLQDDESIQSINDLKAHFDPKLHEIHVSIVAHYKSFYTKQNVISGHTHDCSNFEKGVLDVFCDAKHLDIANDKYITELKSKKVQSEDGTDKFEVHFEIVNR